MFQDLREYLGALEERGWLVRVGAELSPVLEIPALLRRAMKHRGPALLFEKVAGYPGWRVAGNLFGSLERIELALGVKRLEEVGERLVSFAWRAPPLGIGEKIRGLRDAVELGRYAPRLSRRAAFTDTVLEGSEASFKKLPLFKTWPGDGGRYITFGQLYYRDPATGVTGVSVYRVMVKNEREAVVHWQLHKRGRHAFLEALERGEEGLRVAIAIGGPPAAMLAGVMPVPYPLDKLLFAGVMAGEGIRVYRLPSDVLVPATAEAVLEGTVLPRFEEEGPFGDHWGYYDKPLHRFPVFRLERLWLRREPVYVGTVVGKPVMEDAAIGKAVERVFLPIIRTLLPEIVDVNLPEHGVFQGLAVVSIRKTYPGQAKKVMMALWGLGQFSLTKIIIVVDESIDVHDLGQVLWAVAANVDPQRDVVVVPGTHTDHLDPATPVPGYGSKLGIDATKKLPEEYGGREWPREVEPDPRVEEKIERLAKELGL